jgi:hypothetical protein
MLMGPRGGRTGVLTAIVSISRRQWYLAAERAVHAIARRMKLERLGGLGPESSSRAGNGFGLRCNAFEPILPPRTCSIEVPEYRIEPPSYPIKQKPFGRCLEHFHGGSVEEDLLVALLDVFLAKGEGLWF